MSDDSFLDVLPLWAVFAVTLAGMLASFECGYRYGLRRRRTTKTEKESPVGALVAAELGLLAFLLAFTFGIASSRLDDRRRALLDEANAIGTTYLRAELLPEPHRTAIRHLLRTYVDARLTAAGADAIAGLLMQSDQLHARLWAEAVAVTSKDPRPVPTGMFVESLNQVIDMHATRMQAVLRSRVPGSVWLVLLTVAVLSFFAMGYDAGLTGSSRSPAVLAVALTFAVVIWLVADLDRPHQGLLRVNQQPMRELQKSMAAG